mmetsp:Transcript_62207/g.109586  ORF Transcript_62207/g.109586 Transcript_62207/m.109586 type:complete len:370 (-) Transcript_62207:799-1908(-)
MCAERHPPLCSTSAAGCVDAVQIFRLVVANVTQRTIRENQLAGVIETEHIERLEQVVCQDFHSVLYEEPRHTVDPDVHDEIIRLALCEALNGDVIHGGFRPGERQNGGNEKRHRRRSDQTPLRSNAEEPIGPSARGEQREEVRNRHFEVDGRGDLTVRKTAHLKLTEKVSMLPGLQGNLEQEQRRHARDSCQHRRHHEHHAQVPLLGGVARLRVVVTNRNEGAIVQQSNQHEHQHGHLEELGPLFGIIEFGNGFPTGWHVFDGLECENGNEKEHQQLESGGDAIRQEVGNAYEDAAGDENAFHHSGQTRLGQHDVCGGAGSVGSARDCDSDISALQSGGIIHTISSHADLVAELSQTLHDQILLLWKHV